MPVGCPLTAKPAVDPCCVSRVMTRYAREDPRNKGGSRNLAGICSCPARAARRPRGSSAGGVEPLRSVCGVVGVEDGRGDPAPVADGVAVLAGPLANRLRLLTVRAPAAPTGARPAPRPPRDARRAWRRTRRAHRAASWRWLDRSISYDIPSRAKFTVSAATLRSRSSTRVTWTFFAIRASSFAGE